MLHDECIFVEERINARIVTESTLIKIAIGAVLSEEGGKLFSKTIKKLQLEALPRDILSEE
jgi:hypothetical protein